MDTKHSAHEMDLVRDCASELIEYASAGADDGLIAGIAKMFGLSDEQIPTMLQMIKRAASMASQCDAAATRLASIAGMTQEHAMRIVVGYFEHNRSALWLDNQGVSASDMRAALAEDVAQPTTYPDR